MLIVPVTVQMFAVLKGCADRYSHVVDWFDILCVSPAHPGDCPVVSQPGDRDGL